MVYSLEIKKLSEKLINISIIAAALFITPAVATSLLRYIEIGWHNIFIFHIILTILVYSLYFLRKKISLKVKTLLFTNIFMFTALIGLLNFKLVGGYYLAFPSIIIATLILGKRTGFIYLFIFILSYITVWLIHEYSLITIAIDFNEYVQNKIVWFTTLLGYIFGLATIIYIGGEFYRLFTNSIKELSKKSDELKDALEKYKYSEERFSIFMNKSPFPISIINKKGKYVYANKALLSLYKKDVTKTGDISPQVIFPESLAEKINNENKNIFNTNKASTFNIETEVDGNFNYYRVSKFPLNSPDNEPLIGSITIDETKQKRAEFQIEISEKKYRSIFEGSVDSFVFINKEGYILECNNSFCELIDYNKDELVGNNYFSFHKEKYSDIEKSFINESIEKKQIDYHVFEKKFIKKDKTEVPVEMHLNKLELGNKTFFWAIIRNMTEKKRLEQKIYHTMINAEESERTRYARELHDGLGPLLSTCKIYFHTLAVIDDEEKKKEHIKRTGELLDEAIGSIREISNNLSPDILHRYGLEQAIKSFSGKLKNVSDVNFLIKSNLDIRLSETEEITLYRTIIELINNSIKYSEASKIEVNLDYNIDTKYLLINYMENGKGFDYENVKSQGKGFGLINLENRINKIGGSYLYKSEKGKGVQVDISLKMNNV